MNNRMSHFDDPTHLMCLSCGVLSPRTEASESDCSSCHTPLKTDELVRLYEYAAEVYYYGRQYRLYYEREFGTTNQPIRPSLLFAGEAFAWVMLAVLSGVVGNAAYDTIKLVVGKLQEGVRSGKFPNRDYSRLLELTDEELGKLVDAARIYVGGMEGLTREVRAAIVEEFMADTVAHDPLVAQEMMKLMAKKNIKPKHRKRFAELLRGAVVRSRQRTMPPKSALTDLWSALRR